MQFLFEERIILESEVNLEIIKSALSAISDRRSIAGTIAQGAILFNLIVAGKFHAPKGSIFSEFKEIEKYPNTDKSIQLASNIRAAINAFMAKDNRNMECSWVNNFWQRSFQLEPPTLTIEI